MAEFALGSQNIKHARSESVYKALTRACFNKTGNSGLKKFSEMMKHRKICQLSNQQPNRYSAILLVQSVLNCDIDIDVMFVRQIFVL